MIYPVQARPVVRAEQLPTYLDIKKIREHKINSIEQKINTSTQVLGKSSVTTIEHPDQILIANSLKDVIDQKLYKKGQHRLVVVAKRDPANSHPVVNFSGYGIPCLHACDGLESVKDLVKKIDNTHQLAICVQSGSINLWNTSAGSVEDYSSKGFVIHPAKINHSFSTVLTSKNPKAKMEIPQEIKDLLFQFCTETTNRNALTVLQQIQNHGWLKKFAERREKLAGQMKENPLAEKVIKPVLEASSELDIKIKEVFAELTTLLQLPEEKRLHPLIFAKSLEALFFENGKDANGVAQYSIVNMEAYFSAAETQLAYQNELSHPAHFIHELMFGMDCPIPEVFDDWQHFLFQLEKLAEENINTEEMRQFQQMLASLKDLGVMPWFMTVTFGESNHLPPLERMQHLLTQLPEKELPLLKEMIERKEHLQSMFQQIETFADPNSFRKAFESLKDEVEKFIPEMQQQICLKNTLVDNSWKKTSPLVRVVAIEAMNTLVDLYDTAVKTMKSSQQFNNEKEKTKIFKEMLFPYFSLLKSWVQVTLGPNSFPWRNFTQDNYLETILDLLNKMSDEDPSQLDPSRDFSVSAAAFGSGTLFERHYPQTLEDTFTLIHQNLLATIAKLSSQLLSDEQIVKTQLEPLIKQAISKVPQIGEDRVGSPQRIGLEITEDSLTIHYNVPLRNHSSRFALCYSVNGASPTTTMHCQFLGEARNRWNQSAEVVEFYNKLLNLIASPPEVSPNELKYSLNIANSSVDAALKIFKIIAKYSLAYTIDDLQKDIVSHIDQLNLCYKAIEMYASKEEEFLNFSMCVGLFIKLIEKGENLAEVSKFLQFGMSSYDWKEKDNANDLSLKIIKIYDEIVKKGSNYQQAAGVLSIVILCNLFLNYDNYKEFASLLDFLCEYGGEQEIEKAAIDLTANNGKFSMVGLRWFYEKLFEKEIGYQSAIQAAKKYIISIDSEEINIGKWIYKELIAQGIEIQSILEEAQKLLASQGYNERSAGVYLFENLIDNGLRQQEALDAACELTFNGHCTSIHATSIFKKLVSKGFEIESLKKIAAEALLSDNQRANIVGIDTFISLFHSGHVYSEIFEVVRKGIFIGKGTGSCLHMFFLLLMEGKGIKEIMEIAKEAYLSDNMQIRKNGLILYGYLRNVKDAHDIALNAINEALQSDNEELKAAAEKLVSPW